MKNIVLTGGGTAGHCIPHFAILPKIKEHFDGVYYVGSINGIEKDLVKSKQIPYFAIETVKLKRKLTPSNLSIPFKLIKGIKEAEKVLTELKPNVVFSKGGFVGLPVTIAAKKLNIPIVVHESDLSVGLSNKIASKYSDYTLTSFEETAKTIKNGLHVGSPIREELFSVNKQESLKHYRLSGNKPVLLVTGGSLGAQKINQLVTEIIPYSSRI